jgi:hypothetical protein
MANIIDDWVSDFTGGDTNDPQNGDTPALGTELREVKAVIRGESLNKWFESTKIEVTYDSGGNTFLVPQAELDMPPSLDPQPGEVLLLTQTGEPAEFWAVVTERVLVSTDVAITVATGVTLDADLTHMRRSIFRPDPHPANLNYATQFKRVSPLPAQIFTTYNRCDGTNQTFTLGTPFFIPAALNYRVFCTPVDSSLAANAGAYRVRGINKSTSIVEITLNDAPGSGEWVNWMVTFFVE